LTDDSIKNKYGENNHIKRFNDNNTINTKIKRDVDDINVIIDEAEYKLILDNLSKIKD